jgi:hypothetical protein
VINFDVTISRVDLDFWVVKNDWHAKRPVGVIVVSLKPFNAKIILSNMLKAEYHSRAGASTKVFSGVSDDGNTDLCG